MQRSFSARLILTAVALAFWFWTQSLIGARPSPASGIGDAIHNATASLNLYLQNHAAVTNTLLIVSSIIIDFLAVFILSLWIFRGDAQPFLGLVIVLALRQLMQACIALPAPPGTIWRYPGFPSLVVTYGVANDYFFSSHTAIAVIGAIMAGALQEALADCRRGRTGSLRGCNRAGAARALHHGCLHRVGYGPLRRTPVGANREQGP